MITLNAGQRVIVIPGDSVQIVQPRGGAAVSSLLTDLISYWAMEEATGATRVDGHGTNNLTDNNNCIQQTGKVSNAVEFDDTGSMYLSHVDNADLSVNGDQDFALAFWFNQRNLWAADYIVSKYQGGGSNNDEYYIGWVSRTIRFVVRAMDNSSQTLNWGSILADNTWYFCVCWRDSSNIYIDINNSGSPVSAVWGKSQKDSTQDFYVGRLGGTYADTYVDELGFWKRILTADEKTALYNGGSGTTYPF